MLKLHIPVCTETRICLSAYADCCNVSQAKKNDCDLLLSISLVNITYLYIYICFMTF